MNFPWLQELHHFTIERRAEWVQPQVEIVAQAERDRGSERRRTSLQDSTKKQMAWIKRRAPLKGGLAHPRWCEAEEVRRSAIYLVEVISRAVRKSGALVGRRVRLTRSVTNLLEALEAPGGGAAISPSFTPAKLQRAAWKMVGKASGPDGWEASHFFVLERAQLSLAVCFRERCPSTPSPSGFGAKSCRAPQPVAHLSA